MIKVSEDIGESKQSIFSIFTDYLTEILKVGDAIEWQEAELFEGPDASKNKDKVTICFFGECGTGKSTDLTLLAKMYKNQHQEACEEQEIKFKSAQSTEAVTTKIKID